MVLKSKTLILEASDIEHDGEYKEQNNKCCGDLYKDTLTGTTLVLAPVAVGGSLSAEGTESLALALLHKDDGSKYHTNYYK